MTRLLSLIKTWQPGFLCPNKRVRLMGVAPPAEQRLRLYAHGREIAPEV